MFVATLLTAPPDAPPDAPPGRAAVRPLDAETVDRLCTAWGGSDLRWLAPGEAVEFALPARPDEAADVAATLRAQGVDLVIQPAAGRRKSILIADMDSTMIGQECIDELADMAGVGAYVAGITARAMNGELDFEAALRERVELLRGLPVSVVEQVLASRITLTPGGPALLATMKAHGGHAALVSGGFTRFSGPIAARLGFDEHQANTLVEADGRLTGEVTEPILGQQAKLDALHAICARLGRSPVEVMAVGDGANDLAMIGAAGAGVALHAKPSVAARAGLRIDHGDLSALLYLQGYSRSDFVTP